MPVRAAMTDGSPICRVEAVGRPSFYAVWLAKH